jgi:TctA family transporter
LFGLLLLTLLITVIPYRKGERWAWYAVLASLILSAIGSVGLNIPTGDLGIVILTGSIHLVALVGLAIGVRPHFRK